MPYLESVTWEEWVRDVIRVRNVMAAAIEEGERLQARYTAYSADHSDVAADIATDLNLRSVKTDIDAADIATLASGVAGFKHVKDAANGVDVGPKNCWFDWNKF